MQALPRPAFPQMSEPLIEPDLSDWLEKGFQLSAVSHQLKKKNNQVNHLISLISGSDILY